MSVFEALTEHIHRATGEVFVPVRCDVTGGGCINRAAILSATDGTRYFAKFNDTARLAMFEGEFEGLRELAGAGAVRVPRPVCTGRADGQAFLILECLDLAHGDTNAERRFGQQLATLHRVTRPRFGWHRDNTIGSTPQSNGWCDDWATFFRERRLRTQLALVVDNGPKRLRDLGDLLISRVSDFFPGYRPAASLLHGDLWSGNVATTRAGEPVSFDPAVYFGDREADIAMTELFGGFSAAFYDAYREAWPLDPGYRTRKELYNLYHVLNHFNLFGGGYGVRAENMVQRLLSELH
jgi:protein-ribulosamine 3-kinase